MGYNFTPAGISYIYFIRTTQITIKNQRSFYLTEFNDRLICNGGQHRA